MTKRDSLTAKLDRGVYNLSIRQVTTILERKGFVYRDGKHRNFSHPDHPELGGSIPRSKELLGVYPRLVKKWLARLDELEKKDTET